MSNRNEKKSDAIKFGWWYGRVEQMSEDIAYLEDCQDYLFDLVRETEDPKERKMYLSKMFQVDNMRFKMSKAFRSMMEKMRDRYPSFEYKQGEPCIMANLVMLEDGKVRIKDRRVVIKTVKEHLGDNANRSGFIEP